MYDVAGISADAQAIVLACSSLGLPARDEVKPFGPRGWAQLQAAVEASALGSPSALHGLTASEIQAAVRIDGSDAARLATLLARGGQLAFELDRLRSRGIWVMTQADETYPEMLRQRLGPDAPPLLFGSGDQRALCAGGIAVVGSRDADADALVFTERLASAAAAAGTSIVSGGARGIDQEAMRAALARGGLVVGVLPEGIERRIRDASTRTAVGNGQAVLVSPYHPAAGFSAGAAMARNKLIYALADVAVVVSSGVGSGGTWAGAVEALEAGWVPVFVRDEPSAPDGNRELVARGGVPLEPDSIGTELTADELVAAASSRPRQVAEARTGHRQASLWDAV